MKFREMTVWSGGNENAKNAKVNAIFYLFSFCLIILTIILSFVINPNDDKTVPVTILDHLFFGFFMMFLLGWIAFLMFYGFKSELRNIRENKLISLYLYDLDSFSKMGGIPEEKFILFSDSNGIVLANKKHENESRAFSFGAKYFYEFEEYFDKKSINSEVILLE